MEKLEEKLGSVLTEKKLTIATAESCTGGLIGHRLTNVVGSSAYFKGGIIAYHNEIKIFFLHIPKELIEQNGAVCEMVATGMAKGVREVMDVDVGIGVTGIAGPGGGTIDKPVGLVYIAVSLVEKLCFQKFIFSGSREEVKWQTSEEALKMILKMIES